MRLVVLFALVAMSGDAWAGARASAFAKESKLGANYWSGASAIDGKTSTAWMVPGESDNKGEWIEIDVPRGDVDKVAIYPGFGKSEETFTDYPRVKKIRVDVYALDDDQNAKQVGTATIDVADKAELQEFDIADAKIDAGLFGGKVRFNVLEVYEGEDYPNLAISELVVGMKEFDATVTLTEPSAESAGKGIALTQDGNAKTLWAAPGTTASFEIETAGFGLSSIGFTGAGKDYARPKTIEITAAGNTTTTVLEDKTDMQFAKVPAFNGYTGGAFGGVEVKILDVYPGKNAEIGITEIKAKATTLETI